jgi:hypothetical protein
VNDRERQRRLTDRVFLRRERRLGMTWDDDGAEYLSYFRGGMNYAGLELAVATQQVWHALRPAFLRLNRRLG